MATKYEYQFIQADPTLMVGRLQEVAVERWEPVGFSMAPSGDYVVMLRRAMQRPAVVDERRAAHSD